MSQRVIRGWALGEGTSGEVQHAARQDLNRVQAELGLEHASCMPRTSPSKRTML
jgi:hypothetical protein